MDRAKLEELLKAVAAGTVSAGDALDRLKDLPYQDLGYANLDSHRGVRQGLPEVVFCPGKTTTQIVEIMRRQFAEHDLVLATRADKEIARAVQQELAGVVYHEQSRCLSL